MKINKHEENSITLFYNDEFIFFSQENCTTIKDENNYLKKILDINKPVSEISKDNTTFKIIKVAGDKAKEQSHLRYYLKQKMLIKNST